MAKIYVDLIQKGYKQLEEVPEQLREAVTALLKGTV